jgi:hypothetical protein
MRLSDEKEITAADAARRLRIDGYREESVHRKTRGSRPRTGIDDGVRPKPKLRRELCLPPVWPDEGWQ